MKEDVRVMAFDDGPFSFGESQDRRVCLDFIISHKLRRLEIFQLFQVEDLFFARTLPGASR